MPFKIDRTPEEPDFSRLVNTLNASQLQQKNHPLYQVIKALIDNSGQTTRVNKGKFAELETAIADVAAAAGGGGGDGDDISDKDFLTWSDESPTLPNSRNLIAGTGVTFDDTVVNERTINVSAVASAYYDSPLTDGDIDETELIFALGDCVIVQVPI